MDPTSWNESVPVSIQTAADDVAAALGRAFRSPRRSSTLAKAWRRKTCSTRSRFRLRNATRMFRWSWTRRLPRPRAFGVRQLLSRCCVDTDRAASPVRNTIAATDSPSSENRCPTPIYIDSSLWWPTRTPPIPSEPRRTNDLDVVKRHDQDPDGLAPVWLSGRFTMTIRPPTVGICSQTETGTFNTAESTTLGMAVRDRPMPMSSFGSAASELNTISATNSSVALAFSK